MPCRPEQRNIRANAASTAGATFEQVMSAGTAYGSVGLSPEELPQATSGIRVTLEDVERVITDINTRFGLSLAAGPAILDRLRARLPLIAGQVWLSQCVPSRADTEMRLERIRNAAQTAVADLQGAKQGVHEAADSDFASFLIRVVSAAHPEATASEAFAIAEGLVTALESLEFYCDLGLQVLQHLPARKGRPKLGWFDQYLELMTEIAGHLGIEVRTMGKLESDPQATPFTVLVYGFETLLAQEVRSDTLGTCAQRIQRSRRGRKTK
jgi:hypothetical protein